MILSKIKNKVNDSVFIKRLLQGTFWMTFGSLISRGLLTLASIVLVRLLTVNEYGEFGMVKSTIDNFLIFASMGIGLTTTKYVSELKDKDKDSASSVIGAALTMVLILSLFIATIIILCSNYISINILDNIHLKWPLILGGLSLIFIAVNGTQMGALLGLQSYKGNSLSNILQGLFLFGGLCIGGYFGGVFGAILGNLIAVVLASFVLQVILRKEALKNHISINMNNWKDNWKKIYKFAIPASLSTIIVAPTVWILNSILVNQSNGYQELGIYSAIIIFSSAIRMFNGSISNVLLPIFLSRSEEITPKKEFFNYFGTWIISIFLSVPLILFPEIASFILGNKFSSEDVVPILGLTIFSTLIISNRDGIGRDLIMQNKMWLSVFSMGQWALTTFCVFYFIKYMGAYGYALSYAIGYFINLIIMYPFYIYKRICPPDVFYNKWVFFIWATLILLILSINTLDNLLYRGIFSTLLIGVLIYNVLNLYKRWLEK